MEAYLCFHFLLQGFPAASELLFNLAISGYRTEKITSPERFSHESTILTCLGVGMVNL